MLLEYRVSNFMSIKDEIRFEMTASEDDNLPNHIIEFKELQILRCAGIFGANASGKSNLLKSIDFSRDFIIEGTKNRNKIAIKQFKLVDSFNKKPSKFQFSFICNNEVYDYGFSITTDRVVEEWLYKITNNKERPLFTRKTNINGKIELEVFSSMARKDSKLRKRLELIGENLGEKQKNQLYLSKMNENNVSLASKIYDWFEKLTVIYPNTRFDISNMISLQDDKEGEFLSFLSTSLKNLDTGIDKIELTKQKFEFEEVFDKYPDEIKEKINESIGEIRNEQLSVISINRKKYMIIREKDELNILKLTTSHFLGGKSKINFELFEESDGTQRLFDLLPALFDLLKNDRVYLIDELDRSLHSLLSKKIIQTFLENNKNKKLSQFIFTSHDTTLMELLRSDEIWFIEKNEDKSSTVHSLYDYDLNKIHINSIGYLNGRFGGTPLIKEIILPNNRRNHK